MSRKFGWAQKLVSPLPKLYVFDPAKIYKEFCQVQIKSFQISVCQERSLKIRQKSLNGSVIILFPTKHANNI